MRSAVNASTPPVEVLKLCDSGGDVFSGRVVVFVVALSIHPSAAHASTASALGNGHPQTQGTQYFLKMARAKLDATRACA